MYFSSKHSWMGDTSVQQILVFPTQALLDKYQKKIQAATMIDRIDSALRFSQNGAIYVIRAIKEGDNEYRSTIRTSLDMRSVFEHGSLLPTETDAFIRAIRWLMEYTQSELSMLALKIVQGNDTESKEIPVTTGSIQYSQL